MIPTGVKKSDRRDAAGSPTSAAAVAGGWRPSAAGALLLAYLAGTLPLLLAGGPGGARAVVVALHWAALAAVAGLEARRARPRRRVERVLADWHLPLLLPALYTELPWIMAGVAGGYHDAAVAALEGRLFGGQPAYAWAGAWPLPWLSETLHAAYLSYYPLIYLPPLLLYLRAVRREVHPAGVGGASWSIGERRGLEAMAAYRTTVAGLGLSMLACYVVFVLWPVQGPRYLGAPAGVPDGPVRALALLVLESGSSRGAAFPSSHVSVAVAQTLLALRLQPRVGVVLAVLTPLLAAGAVYGGFHYAIDVAAGAVVGVAAAAAAGPLHAFYRGR